MSAHGVCCRWVGLLSTDMTTLENRPNTALLVVDVQNGVVGGAQTDECIRGTLHRRDRTRVRRDPGQRRAHDRGSVAVGCTTPDMVIPHTNLYWTYHRAPGRTAGTMQTKQVEFGPAASEG